MSSVTKDILEKAYSTLCTAKAMAELYEANFKQVSKYILFGPINKLSNVTRNIEHFDFFHNTQKCQALIILP